MSVKDLLIQSPALCGASNAVKHAEVARIVWDHEQGKKGFNRIEGESAMDRIAFLFDWDCENVAKREYCRNLAHFCVLKHYAVEHKDSGAAVEALRIQDAIEDQEYLYPDVAEVLTVEAAAAGNWY